MRLTCAALPLLSLIVFAGACAPADPEPRVEAPPAAIQVTGAGATFPYPVYTRWFSRFGDETGIRINYQSIGSGAGVRALAAGTVAFAATDIPLSASDRELLRDRQVRQVPLIVGGAAVSYHLPSVDRQLRLDGAALADIISGGSCDGTIRACLPSTPTSRCRRNRSMSSRGRTAVVRAGYSPST
jgi:ABC-type phosphate transport system substrate-binding protein